MLFIDLVGSLTIAAFNCLLNHYKTKVTFLKALAINPRHFQELQCSELSTSTLLLACSSTRRRRVFTGRLAIFESADNALLKMVRNVLLRPLRQELDGQDVEASCHEDTSLPSR
jgi:hypothetical protein